MNETKYNTFDIHHNIAFYSEHWRRSTSSFLRPTTAQSQLFHCPSKSSAPQLVHDYIFCFCLQSRFSCIHSPRNYTLPYITRVYTYAYCCEYQMSIVWYFVRGLQCKDEDRRRQKRLSGSSRIETLLCGTRMNSRTVPTRKKVIITLTFHGSK